VSIRRLAVALGVALLVNGCATTKKAVFDPALTAADVLRHIHEREERVRTVLGEGRITIESPEASGSGSFTANVRKPDSAKVEITGPLGIRIGTLALSRTEVVYYDWRANTVTIGPPNEKTLQSMLNVNLRFEEVLHAFTGEFLAFAEGDSLSTFSVAEKSYVLKFQNGEAVREYYVDGESFIITSYRLLDANGSAMLVAQASRPDEVAGIEVPTLLRIIMPRERRSLTVAYNNLELNGAVRCSFTIPRAAEIRRR
jgi:outer membrane lipoprotein-sorting protein